MAKIIGLVFDELIQEIAIPDITPEIAPQAPEEDNSQAPEEDNSQAPEEDNSQAPEEDNVEPKKGRKKKEA